jgi:hypothetical protein
MQYLLILFISCFLVISKVFGSSRKKQNSDNSKQNYNINCN